MYIQKILPSTQYNISQLGVNVEMPNYQRNYCKFNERRVNEILKDPNNALPEIEKFLLSAKTEEQICESLYVIDRMADKKIKGINNLYPTLSKYNYTTSPNIQVLLAGIYRKTLVPDAYGPLNRMLMQQIFHPTSPYFDPTEEIGGAILEYNRFYTTNNAYKNN